VCSQIRPASRLTSAEARTVVACGRKRASGRTRLLGRPTCAALLSILLQMPLAAVAQSTAPPAASPTPPAAPAATSVFGIDLGRDTDAAAVAREGINWVRATADWSLLEPTRGRFDWADLDKTVDRAAAARLRVVLVLLNTPRWAALDQDTPETIWRHQPPRDLADWQRFVAEAAARYRGRVAGWQIISALDFAIFRGTVSDYLGMLRTARLAIRLADPNALVVAASPRGLDLSYIKAMLVRPADDFDALMLFTKGRAPEEVIEGLAAIRSRTPVDPRRQLWLSDGDAGGPQVTPDDAVGDLMARTAAVGVAAGVTREFWSDRQGTARWTAVRQTLVQKLDGARPSGWLPRAPGVYAFVVMMKDQSPAAVVWSTAEPRALSLPTDRGLTILTAGGEPAPLSNASRGESTVPAGRSPVFVLGVAPSVIEEAVQAAQKGPFRPARDPARDFTNADSVSISLAATNTERGLYNQRFRSLPSGAVVPVTVDGAEAVRTDAAKEVLYVYLDVDHSYAYFVDGQQDILITVQVHRAKAAQQAGFNILYDSTTGYRFTPWQWIEPGTGWVTYTLRITDAGFSSTWGWDFAINAAGTRKEPLIVRSVTVRKVQR
jgi:Beta-galactosidase